MPIICNNKIRRKSNENCTINPWINYASQLVNKKFENRNILIKNRYRYNI